jgi:very-short-patch-repair endonuclease
MQSAARALRQDSTHAEDVLWDALRRRPGGLKFRRQHPFETWVFDFYCASHLLVLEVDGGVHDTEEQRVRDRARDEACEHQGLVVLRVSNENVLLDLESVITTVLRVAGAIAARRSDQKNDLSLQ